MKGLLLKWHMFQGQNETVVCVPQELKEKKNLRQSRFSSQLCFSFSVFLSAFLSVLLLFCQERQNYREKERRQDKGACDMQKEKAMEQRMSSMRLCFTASIDRTERRRQREEEKEEGVRQADKKDNWTEDETEYPRLNSVPDLLFLLFFLPSCKRQGWCFIFSFLSPLICLVTKFTSCCTKIDQMRMSIAYDFSLCHSKYKKSWIIWNQEQWRDKNSNRCLDDTTSRVIKSVAH